MDTIFLDVDGVLADFTGHALAQFGRPDLARADRLAEYSLAKVLGMSTSKFWRNIDTPDFWRTIPVYDGAHAFAKQLHTYCNSLDIKLYFCSVGTVSEHYPSERRRWIGEFNRTIGVDIPAILMSHGGDKALLAKPSRLFIDDNDLVLNAVERAGGRTVRVPQPWNEGYRVGSTLSINYGRVLKAVKREVSFAMFEDAVHNGDRGCSGRCRCSSRPDTKYVNETGGVYRSVTTVYCEQD